MHNVYKIRKSYKLNILFYEYKRYERKVNVLILNKINGNKIRDSERNTNIQYLTY